MDRTPAVDQLVPEGMVLKRFVRTVLPSSVRVGENVTNNVYKHNPHLKNAFVKKSVTNVNAQEGDVAIKMLEHTTLFLPPPCKMLRLSGRGNCISRPRGSEYNPTDRGTLATGAEIMRQAASFPHAPRMFLKRQSTYQTCAPLICPQSDLKGITAIAKQIGMRYMTSRARGNYKMAVSGMTSRTNPTQVNLQPRMLAPRARKQLAFLNSSALPDASLHPLGGDTVSPVNEASVYVLSHKRPTPTEGVTRLAGTRVHALAAGKRKLMTVSAHSPSTVMLSHNPLARCSALWKQCNPSPWVLRTVMKGYRLQFSTKPPMTERVLFSRTSGAAAGLLRDEINSLLSKHAIEEVTADMSRLGYYSNYFLVRKKGGGMRPILDLRGLNKHLKKFNFKMLTNEALLRSVRSRDWFTTLDLKDAYFHVAIFPAHRKFLRFGFEGKVYQYTVLPFGMSLSPRVFVKCTQVALAPLRSKGIRIATFLDDWLLMADSKQQVEHHTRLVMAHLTALGFTINMEKSALVPTQRATFIGVELDSTTLTARMSAERVSLFHSIMTLFQLGASVTYRQCMQMAGLMASALSLIRLGRFHMRPFQRWVISLGIPSSHRSRRVIVTPACVTALLPWRTEHFLTQGVNIGLVVTWRVVTTDASLSGWGATFEGHSTRGLWTGALTTAHINYLELMAVFLALRHFLPLLRQCHILVKTDNITTKYYINKQGGLHSRKLDTLAREITLWCEAHLASVRAEHIPGLSNSGADLMSRGGYRYADWSLHPAVAEQIWQRYGLPEADLFAAVDNTKLPLFFAAEGRAPLGVDAMANEWPQGLLYAFPPLHLIAPLLERIRTRGARVLLVAPGWGSWVQNIVPLLYRPPWILPLRRDLLRQAGNEIFHPNPGHLDLRVWPVSASV